MFFLFDGVKEHSYKNKTRVSRGQTIPFIYYMCYKLLHSGTSGLSTKSTL